ncbi:MAG: hypothetical protein OXH73_03195 [Caldilineaceae bacterium]|nr:hypothetical protein [Caldilineaceae bacterium]
MELALLAWFVLFPILSGIIASKKGRSVVGWVLLGLLFGIFSFLVLIFLPENRQAVEAQYLASHLRSCRQRSWFQRGFTLKAALVIGFGIRWNPNLVENRQAAS